MIMAIVILLTTTISAMEFEKRNNQSGLVFKEISKTKISYDSFVLVYHVNLTDYFEIENKIIHCIGELGKICKHQGTFCDILRVQAERKLHMLEQDEINIKLYEISEGNRNKRHPALAAAAIFTSVAFGLIDGITLRKYDGMIRGLRTDYEILRRIDVEKTVFLKENLLTNKNTFKFLTNLTLGLTDQFNTETDNFYKDLSAVNRELIISKLVELISIWIDEHKYLSDSILTHLENILYGKLSRIIPFVTFQQDLKEIEKMLPNHQKLPINIYKENPLSIFKYTSTRTSIFNKRLYIEIAIPKVDNEIYNLFKIIPIPIRVDDFLLIIIPSMDYVLIDENHKSFIPLTCEEVNENSLQHNTGAIITPNDNVYHNFHDNCEMSLLIDQNPKDIKKLCNVRNLPLANYFISLGSFNQYFISISKPATLIETCEKKPINRKTITKSGILTLTDNCLIRTNKITLRSRVRTRMEHNGELEILTGLDNTTFNYAIQNITQFTKPEHLQYSQSSILIDDHIKEFNSLADNADEIMEKLAFNNKFDDIYQDKIQNNFFIILGMISFTAIIFIGCSIYIYKKFYNLKTWTGLAGRLSGNQTPRVHFSNANTLPIT